MPNNTVSTAAKVVNVAVAIIDYINDAGQPVFLLGYRQAHQHQGDRYEFVGGKIDVHETPHQALVREVAEEIGCDITQNQTVKLGVIRHDYTDKCVALHIFRVTLDNAQFDALQYGQGLEGQRITWASKDDLLANCYRLPDANARIVDWLSMQNMIFISQALDTFANAQTWLDHYDKKLPHGAGFYIRPQSDVTQAALLIKQILNQRADITPIVQYQTVLHHPSIAQDAIVHLNHSELFGLDVEQLPTQWRYFASCHDEQSLETLNQFAKSHTVMGGFLSPILPTPTHPEAQGMGWQTFGELAAISDVPIYALGGVGLTELATAQAYGASGIAGIRLLAQMTPVSI